MISCNSIQRNATHMDSKTMNLGPEQWQKHQLLILCHCNTFFQVSGGTTIHCWLQPLPICAAKIILAGSSLRRSWWSVSIHLHSCHPHPQHPYPQVKEQEPAQEQPKDEASDEIEQSPAEDDEKEAEAEDDKQQQQQQQQSKVGGLAVEATSSVAANSRASRIAGMLQKRAAASKRGKAPPTLANLSLVLPRPLVRPSQPEKKGRKVNLQTASGKKLQASSSNPQAKSSKKTAIQHPPTAPSNLYNQDRQRQGKENQSIECNPGNFSKRESKETLGEDLELDLRTSLALRKRPMTNSERQLLQLDHKTDWTLWEESCLAD